MPQHRLAAPSRILAAAPAHDDDRVAVDYAAHLACALGAELIVLGIAPLVPVGAPTMSVLDVSDLEAQRAEQELVDSLARENLDEVVATLASGLPKETALAWGSPGPATIEAAREHAADLIVVPMRTRDHELARLLHDHADRYVLHHSDIPVLVVPTST
jgi:nucleotide-binding universal stress UspA family protein